MNHRLEKLNKIVRYEEMKISAYSHSISNSNDAFYSTSMKDWHKKRAETYLAIADRLDKRITNLIKEL